MRRLPLLLALALAVGCAAAPALRTTDGSVLLHPSGYYQLEDGTLGRGRVEDPAGIAWVHTGGRWVVSGHAHPGLELHLDCQGCREVLGGYARAGARWGARAAIAEVERRALRAEAADLPPATAEFLGVDGSGSGPDEDDE